MQFELHVFGFVVTPTVVIEGMIVVPLIVGVQLFEHDSDCVLHAAIQVADEVVVGWTVVTLGVVPVVSTACARRIGWSPAGERSCASPEPNGIASASPSAETQTNAFMARGSSAATPNETSMRAIRSSPRNRALLHCSRAFSVINSLCVGEVTG